MEKKWYLIRTYVGWEHRVQAALERKIREVGQGAAFGEILVPTEKVIDWIQGKKTVIERCLFPGYILVQMDLNEKTWHLVHSVPKVVGFVGGPHNPTPLPEEEVQEIVRRVEAGRAAPRPKVAFFAGERVKIVDGPFRDFVGTVEEVKPERSRVRVAVSVFGRSTPVELDFHQVEAA